MFCPNSACPSFSKIPPPLPKREPAGCPLDCEEPNIPSKSGPVVELCFPLELLPKRVPNGWNGVEVSGLLELPSKEKGSLVSAESYSKRDKVITYMYM